MVEKEENSRIAISTGSYVDVVGAVARLTHDAVNGISKEVLRTSFAPDSCFR